jgi:hypothetical protein
MRLLTIALGILALGAASQLAQAAGVCSTGAYKSCVACCNSHPSITNRPLCRYQCGEYNIPRPRSGLPQNFSQALPR